jgi:hypothetical protein
MNTVLFLTDNSLDEQIANLCRRVLVREAGDLPIVSVSQKPIDLGRNVCVGEIGRSWMSIYTQILAGLDAVETDNIAIAEHDCLYTHEHLSYEPCDPGAFHYNKNHWLIQWGGNHPELNGMYSWWPHRIALSQLVCRAELLCESTADVMRLLEMGLKVARGLHWHGEPGAISEQFKKAYAKATSGKPTQLQTYLKDYVNGYRSVFFATINPSLDIRHSSNFTGAKRGKRRCYELPYWGKWEELWQLYL